MRNFTGLLLTSCELESANAGHNRKAGHEQIFLQGVPAGRIRRRFSPEPTGNGFGKVAAGTWQVQQAGQAEAMAGGRPRLAAWEEWTMSRFYLRASKASGSTRRRIERMVRLGERAMRRSLTSAKRRQLMAERVGVHE